MIAKSRIGQEIEQALQEYRQLQQEIVLNPTNVTPELVQRYQAANGRLDSLKITVLPIQSLEEIVTNSAEPEKDKDKVETDGEHIEKYILLPVKLTYALGCHAMKRKAEARPVIGQPKIYIEGRLVYRPFSFYENILARVETYESAKSEEERMKLFDFWIDSCTGIAYKKRTTQFKIIPISKELVTISEGFRDHFLPINYNKIDGIEIDSKKGKYNCRLTKPEFLEHEAWRACVNDDVSLLTTYRNITFAEYKKKYRIEAEKRMGFYVRQDTIEDELRAVYVISLSSSSGALGGLDLNLSSSFLLGSPSRKKFRQK